MKTSTKCCHSMGRFKWKHSNLLHEQWCHHKNNRQLINCSKLKVPGYAQLQAFKSIPKINGWRHSRIGYVCAFCIEICESKGEFTKLLVCFSNYDFGEYPVIKLLKILMETLIHHNLEISDFWFWSGKTMDLLDFIVLFFQVAAFSFMAAKYFSTTTGKIFTRGCKLS